MAIALFAIGTFIGILCYEIAPKAQPILFIPLAISGILSLALSIFITIANAIRKQEK